ncbi:hypothetical protein FE845_12535 [Marinobacter sp. 1-4A]|uniref:LPS-assembly lipoprotein LptE n=1 Tax=unclassified Marinobacter TaxID=83889 RepID=UPI0019074632|nr:LPS assembly lipoprotein LptE [Marinobacter sp. 1-4A]MBK1852174.1 hypothetical protein [Marinobacter sp. 1-4A]
MQLRTVHAGTAKWFIAGLLAANLGACGFQLRSAPPVSSALEPLMLDCQPPVPTSLCLAVRQQLELGGVELATEEAGSNYQLSIRGFEQDRRASAITVQAAAAEYTLRHSVSLELISTDGVPVIANTRLTTTESYRYDETNVLAKQREEDNLQQQLSDRLAQQIIFRLAPITRERLREIRDQHQKSNSPAKSQNATP